MTKRRSNFTDFVWASRDVIVGSVFVGTVLAALARTNPMFAGVALFFVLAFTAIAALAVRDNR